MKTKQIRTYKVWNLLSAVSFLFAITMNALANILPINGLETGVISDTYENYFAPIGLTFSIWAVIYITLAAYVFWRLRHFHAANQPTLLLKVDIAFAISSIANGFWILAWHYLQFAVAMMLMVIILICLIYINLLFKKVRARYTVPFSIYFGWITVATVANMTTWIVADYASFTWLWNGGEVSEVILTTIILTVTILIGNLTSLIQKDIAYGTVIVWALFGIYLKHTTLLPNFGIVGVANTALIGLILSVIVVFYVSSKKLLKR
jgi:hypothetical protein